MTQQGLIALPTAAARDTGVALAAPTQLSPQQIQDAIGPWLPRFQLFGSNSTGVKERVIEAGHWGIPVSPQTIIDLGEVVDVVLVASRQRAMWYDGEKMHSSTDPASAVYQRLKTMSDNDGDSGAMYGAEFLAWVGPMQMFCTLFLASASARRETLGFLQCLNKPAEVHSKLVGTRRKWEVPLCRLTEAFPFDLPSEAAIATAWEKFTKPDEDAEVADATGDNGRER